MEENSYMMEENSYMMEENSYIMEKNSDINEDEDIINKLKNKNSLELYLINHQNVNLNKGIHFESFYFLLSIQKFKIGELLYNYLYNDAIEYNVFLYIIHKFRIISKIDSNKNESIPLNIIYIYKNIMFNYFLTDKFLLNFCLKSIYWYPLFPINGINITSFYECCRWNNDDIAKMIYNFITIDEFDLSNCYTVACTSGADNIVKWLIDLNIIPCIKNINNELIGRMDDLLTLDYFLRIIIIFCKINRNLIVYYQHHDTLKYTVEYTEINIQKNEDLNIDNICQICLDNESNIHNELCKHALCNICASSCLLYNETNVLKCPICRQQININLLYSTI